jgi:DNA-binding NtrC family response regulator
MREYPWPGNVRELDHAVQRAVVLARGPQILPGDLGLDTPADLGRQAMPVPPSALNDGPVSTAGTGTATEAAGETLSALERERIRVVLDRYQGNRRAAARALGIDPSTLWRKLRRHAGRESASIRPT